MRLLLLVGLLLSYLFILLLYVLPVCRGRPWTDVLWSQLSSYRGTPGARGHKATGIPGGSRPAPSAPDRLEGLGLLYLHTMHSELYTQAHTHITHGIKIIVGHEAAGYLQKANRNSQSSCSITLQGHGTTH